MHEASYHDLISEILQAKHITRPTAKKKTSTASVIKHINISKRAVNVFHLKLILRLSKLKQCLMMEAFASHDINYSNR